MLVQEGETLQLGNKQALFGNETTKYVYAEDHFALFSLLSKSRVSITQIKDKHQFLNVMKQVVTKQTFPSNVLVKKFDHLAKSCD